MDSDATAPPGAALLWALGDVRVTSGTQSHCLGDAGARHDRDISRFAVLLDEGDGI